LGSCSVAYALFNQRIVRIVSVQSLLKGDIRFTQSPIDHRTFFTL